MQALAGEAILRAWEQSYALPEQQGALAILALALGEKPQALARLPLGERNALLLELRATTLGRSMDVFAVCPECKAQLEFSLDALELIRSLRTPTTNSSQTSAGYTMRPADTIDLLASCAAEDEAQARSVLLARTLAWNEPLQEGRSAYETNQAWLLSQSPSTLDELTAHFDELNAAAEILVQVQCVACRSDSLINLDIAKFLSREIAIAARRLMTEIHDLASAYGWSEASIAAMSAARRSAYLERIGA